MTTDNYLYFETLDQCADQAAPVLPRVREEWRGLELHIHYRGGKRLTTVSRYLDEAMTTSKYQPPQPIIDRDEQRGRT